MVKSPGLYWIFLPLALISTKAFSAGCTFVGAPKTEKVVLPTLAIDPNLPIGSVIGGKTISTAGLIALTCTGSTSYRSMMMGSWSTPSATIPNVYETGVPGVGVRISDYVVSDRYVPVTSALSPNQTTPLSGSDIRLLFYRTGDITPGNFPTGIVARFSLPNSSGTMTNVLSLQIMAGGARIKSCYAKSPTLTVSLGSHSRKEFTGVGSLSAMKSFNVELTCQGDSLPVSVSFDANGGTASPAPGVVPLDNSEGSATGVAIKVFNQDGSPLEFAMPKTYHTNNESKITIPLQASYIQMMDKITPGAANSAITFTITQN